MTDGKYDIPTDEEDEEQKLRKEKEELEKLVQLGRDDGWRNIRGPRPWEDNKEYNEWMEDLKKRGAKVLPEGGSSQQSKEV